MSDPITSPCRNICRLGGDGLCDGCGRTLDEIARWPWMPALARADIFQRVADWTPRPAAARAE